jgi:hypothetical protein
MAMARLIRINLLHHSKGRDGLLPVGKSKLHSDYLLKDPDNPLIPGTPVRRLSLIYLGDRTSATTEDEVERLIAELAEWSSKVPRGDRDPGLRERIAAASARRQRKRRKGALASKRVTSLETIGQES